MRLLLGLILSATTVSALYPQKNELRTFDRLDGLWTFVREETNAGDVGKAANWNEVDLALFENSTVMPVPSAYNDLTMDADVRDHVGWVWYQKREYIAQRDHGQSITLRFESVNYFATVYLNGEEIGSHVGGHLPFEFDITDKIRYGQENKITVAVNNTLSWATIPQGDFNYVNIPSSQIRGKTLTKFPDQAFKNTGLFDFFNYAGILRSVYIVKRSPSHIDNFRIMAEHHGSFLYEVQAKLNDTEEDIFVHIYDPDGKEVFSSKGANGKGKIASVRPWFPRGMGDADLYTLKVEVIRVSDLQSIDVYREPFGFRTVTWTKNQIFINDKPFYCLGFGMHEDFELHGRGFNPVVMTKDLNTLEWMNGNCYRTSHYPYSQERMYEDDRRGIAVIVETPAVGLKGFPKANNVLHMKMLEDMIDRDKNHPSVFMWSIANEPHTEKKESRNYFKNLIDHAHELDKTRPVTTVFGPTQFDTDQVADMLDIICVNRYYGWYINMGYLSWINQSLYFDIANWRAKFGKPVMLTEYGADSLVGLNQEPSIDFSEQYQNDLIRRTHDAFDALRADHQLAGEMIWNFADFMTGMTTTRAVGNHKGVFTRTRQAKQSAYILRDRYASLFDQHDGEVWDDDF